MAEWLGSQNQGLYRNIFSLGTSEIWGLQKQSQQKTQYLTGPWSQGHGPKIPWGLMPHVVTAWKVSWHAVWAVPPLQIQGNNEFVETELQGQPEAVLRVTVPRAEQSISWLGLGLATSKLKYNLGLCLLQAQILFDALEWKKVPSLHVAMSCVSVGSLTM